jgi:anti-sigma B factor antagonist
MRETSIHQRTLNRASTSYNMEEPIKGISVGTGDPDVFVRVVGRGTFQNGQPLRRYALEMVERGHHSFIVDLEHCTGMDSTFLGVLAGIGLRLRQGGRHGKITVVNASPRSLELLETLGLDRLFAVEPSPSDTSRLHPPQENEWQRLPDSDVAQMVKPLSKDDTADLMLEAHESLIRADHRNEPKFKDLTKFLRDKVDKRKENEQTS